MRIVRARFQIIAATGAATLVLAATSWAEKPSPTAASPAAAKTADSAKAKAALVAFSQALQSGEGVAEAENAAKNAGVSAQPLAELRLLTAVRARNLTELPLRIKEMESVLPQWRAEESTAFEEKPELEAVLDFGKGLLAAEAGDENLFEQSFKQAFWLNPELAPALAEELKARRASGRLASLVLPMEIPFETSAGAKTSLAELAKGQKAILLDFWATWCGPCMNSMPELVLRAQHLASQKVAVIGINTEASQTGGMADAQKKSENVKKQKKIDFAWLVEPAARPLSRLLKIDSIPRVVLASPDGKILYDGHPDDPRLVTALQKIGVTLRE
ncbi:MAG: TlpA disulfide reductase family protein [Chthoniobacterales bacterium]